MSPPAHLVLGSLVLVQLGLQDLLGELDLGLPLAGVFLGMAECGMSCRARPRLLGSFVLTKHHRVPQLEPLQQAAVGVLQGDRKTRKIKGKIQLRAEEGSPAQGSTCHLPGMRWECFPSQLSPSSLRETLDKSHQPHPCWPCSVLAQSALLSPSQHIQFPTKLLISPQKIKIANNSWLKPSLSFFVLF